MIKYSYMSGSQVVRLVRCNILYRTYMTNLTNLPYMTNLTNTYYIYGGSNNDF